MSARGPAPDDHARDGVEATLRRLERIDVAVVVVAPRDRVRRAALERAHEAAQSAGRGAVLDEASTTAREFAIRAFSGHGFSGTWAVADWSISTAGPRDRAAVAAAFEEAVAAAVVDDLVDAETLAVLRGTSEQLAAMTGLREPGGLSNLGHSTLTSGPATVAAMGAMGVAGFAMASVVGAVLGLAAGAAIVGWFARRRSALKRD